MKDMLEEMKEYARDSLEIGGGILLEAVERPFIVEFDHHELKITSLFTTNEWKLNMSTDQR